MKLDSMLELRTFTAMIREHVELHWPLHKSYLPLHETQEGKRVDKETLACIEQQYPQYLREIQGAADGSSVTFHKEILGHNEDALTETNMNRWYLVDAHVVEPGLPEEKISFSELRWFFTWIHNGLQLAWPLSILLLLLLCDL